MHRFRREIWCRSTHSQKKYAQRNNLFDEESDAKVAQKKVGKKKVGKKKIGGKKKQPTKRKLDLGAAAPPEPKKSKEGDGDDGQTSEEDDGVTLNNAFKTAEVLQLEADSSYQVMLKQTVRCGTWCTQILHLNIYTHGLR